MVISPAGSLTLVEAFHRLTSLRRSSRPTCAFHRLAATLERDMSCQGAATIAEQPARRGGGRLGGVGASGSGEVVRAGGSAAFAQTAFFALSAMAVVH